MQDENADLIRRAFDAFSRGDLETAFEVIDPSLEVDDRIVPEANPTERGPAALIANVARVTEAFGDATWEPREIVELDDRVLVRVHLSAKGQHTAMPIEEDVGHIYTVRGGKAVKLDIFRTWEDARRAAGLEGS